MYTYRIYSHKEIKYKIEDGKYFEIFCKKLRINNSFVIIERLLKESPKWKETKSDGILRKVVTFSNFSKYSVLKYMSPNYKKIYKKSNLYRKIRKQYFYLHHIEFKENDKSVLAALKRDNSLWFLKNTSIYTYGGYDVYPIIADNKMDTNISHAIEEMKTYKKYKTDPLFVLQRGIENPMLIDKKKFDIRVYYLILTTNNKISFFVNKYCLIRKSTVPYDKFNMDKAVQLTNTTFQRKHENKLENLTDVMAEGHQLYYLFPKILDLAKKLSKIYAKHFVSNVPTFELLGFDIMFDEDENIYLIEVNITPAVYVNRDEVINLHKNIEDHLFAGFVEKCMEQLVEGNVQASSFDDYVCVFSK